MFVLQFCWYSWGHRKHFPAKSSAHINIARLKLFRIHKAVVVQAKGHSAEEVGIET